MTMIIAGLVLGAAACGSSSETEVVAIAVQGDHAPVLIENGGSFEEYAGAVPFTDDVGAIAVPCLTGPYQELALARSDIRDVGFVCATSDFVEVVLRSQVAVDFYVDNVVVPSMVPTNEAVIRVPRNRPVFIVAMPRGSWSIDVIGWLTPAEDQTVEVHVDPVELGTLDVSRSGADQLEPWFGVNAGGRDVLRVRSIGEWPHRFIPQAALLGGGELAFYEECVGSASAQRCVRTYHDVDPRGPAAIVPPAVPPVTLRVDGSNLVMDGVGGRAVMVTTPRTQIVVTRGLASLAESVIVPLPPGLMIAGERANVHVEERSGDASSLEPPVAGETVSYVDLAVDVHNPATGGAR